MIAKYRSIWATRDLRLLITAFIVDNAASWSYVVVLVAYVFDRTHSETWVTALLTVGWLVGMVSGAYAGVLADRYDRRQLLVVSALASMAAALLLAVLVASDAPVAAVLASAGLVRCFSTPVRPASGALVPEVTPEHELAATNSMFAMLESLVIVIGPGIGALVLFAGDATVGILINAASYLVAAVLYRMLDVRSTGSAERGGSLLKQWSAGIVALTQHQTAFVLTIFLVLDSAAINASNALLPSLSVHLGGGRTSYSLLLAANALGGVVAAMLADKLAASSRVTAIIMISIVVECLPLWVSVFVGSVPPAIVLQVLSGAGMVVVDVMAFTALQRDLPRDVLGRVLGSVDVLLLGGSILASFTASQMVAHVGIGWAFGLIGLGFPAVAFLGVPRLLRLDTTSSAELRTLHLGTVLLERLDLFAAAPQAVLEQLVRGSEEQIVESGTVLMRQGEQADALWVLETGALTVSVTHSGGDEIEVARIEAPGYVGELGLLHNKPRSATVVASTASRVLRISAAEFERALDEGRPSFTLLGIAGARSARTSVASGVVEPGEKAPAARRTPPATKAATARKTTSAKPAVPAQKTASSTKASPANTTPSAKDPIGPRER